MSDIDNFYPTDYVLCGFSGKTHEDYEGHMKEVHGS